MIGPDENRKPWANQNTKKLWNLIAARLITDRHGPPKSNFTAGHPLEGDSEQVDDL